MIVTVTPNPVLDRTLTVEEIILDEMIRATGLREDWGGKGFNVSRALQALGLPSLAMGFIGGAVGRKLEAGLQTLGIATDLTPISGETRTNIVISDAAGKHYIKVNEPGPVVDPQAVQALTARAAERAQPGDLWALCGSLPPGAPADFYAQIISLIQERGARAFLDASGEPLRLGLEARPYLVKPNIPEAEALLDATLSSDRDYAAAARAIQTMGVEAVALSLGKAGLLLAQDGAYIRAVPPEVHAPNPTGAGDALLAGLICAFTQGLPFALAARWGAAAGTAAAMREGVSVGTRAEVEAMLPRIELYHVDW